MNTQHMTAKDYAKAVGIGIATGVILSVVAIVGLKTGISPLPKPLALAFAQRLLGDVPLPVGLLFHVAYVTFWTVVFVTMFKSHTFAKALALALALWVAVLVVFFPFVGWDLLGLGVGPALIPGSLAPHILFAVLIWLFTRWLLPDRSGLAPRNAGHPVSG
ncbi:MAG: hypothetical protein ABIQ90_05775 [Polaromonas sp.]